MDNKVLDRDAYKHSYSHRLAYVEGKLDLCDEIIQIAHVLLANNKISPFKTNNEFEEGQLAALSAILESVNHIQESVKVKELRKGNFVFDA